MSRPSLSTTSVPATSTRWLADLQDGLRESGVEAKILLMLAGVFLAVFFMPVGTPRFDNAVLEGLYLVHGYAREHIILCLLPAFLIAGAIAVFISQGAVLKYLGPAARKVTAYSMAAVSGTILAVCSCTVLPLFGGIYKRGAGLGPALAFLYAGPAINLLAIIITAKILGAEIGLARAGGAVVFAVVIGALMHWLYRREETARAAAPQALAMPADDGKPLSEVALFFALLIGILVLANWAPASAEDSTLWQVIHAWKWPVTGLLAIVLALFLVVRWHWPGLPIGILAGVVAVLALAVPAAPQLAFAVGVIGLAGVAVTQPADGTEWFSQSVWFAKQILPLLLIGVLLAGVLLGRPGHEGLIPSSWVQTAVGGNSLTATFLASLVGAFMYFATLTEVPIVQGLMGAGMGKGPALALLLAGPALSLPNMLVIRRIIGTQKTLVYCGLVVVMATFTGLIYGNFWP